MNKNILRYLNNSMIYLINIIIIYYFCFNSFDIKIFKISINIFAIFDSDFNVNVDIYIFLFLSSIKIFVLI